jgi:hypothetical protein
VGAGLADLQEAVELLVGRRFGHGSPSVPVLLADRLSQSSRSARGGAGAASVGPSPLPSNASSAPPSTCSPSTGSGARRSR